MAFGEVVIADDDIDTAGAGEAHGLVVANTDIGCDNELDTIVGSLFSRCGGKAIALIESVRNVVIESMPRTQQAKVPWMIKLDVVPSTS